ncbi:MAG: ribosome biogenesis GTPase Der [Actinomycetota bacterium]
MTIRLKRVAVVGRPNVGKSTLVNRLAGRRGSIVGPAPGLTRDSVDAEVDWAGRRFLLVDTGGIASEDIDEPSRISGAVAARALSEASVADVVVFVVDSRTGITNDEQELARRLLRLKVPVVVAANKVDDARAEPDISEFWGLGLGEPHPVSGLHGRGSGDLLDKVTDLLPESEPGPADDAVPSIAIVGRPNVGKSSLFNRFAGSERSLVHHEPGTTRDAIDSVIEFGGRQYRFVDTAGLARRADKRGVEAWSAGRTRTAIQRSDLALVVIDATVEATVQDQKIAREVAEAGTAAIIVANKWDRVSEEEGRKAEESIMDRLGFVRYAPVVRTSAVSGRGVSKLPALIEKVLAARSTRVPTARLNTILAEAQQKAPPIAAGGRQTKVLYATQASVGPPEVVLFANLRPADSWLRFFERRLREEFEFTGNPIRIAVRERARRER